MNNEVDLNAAGMLVSSNESLSRINIDLISYQTKAIRQRKMIPDAVVQ